jgi:hypothetical protein
MSLSNFAQSSLLFFAGMQRQWISAIVHISKLDNKMRNRSKEVYR